GIDGDTGKIVDMKEYGVCGPEAVKLQSIKKAIEVREETYLRAWICVLLTIFLVCLPSSCR
ncbi:hypothetical protein HOY82DRAFT_477509, partial [Tuber indicum]